MNILEKIEKYLNETKLYIKESAAPTPGILNFQSIMLKYPGVKSVIIDDWADYSGSTSYSVFVELENNGRSHAATDPRKAGILIDKKINIVKLKNIIKKEAKKLELYIQALASPKKKQEISTFMGKKSSHFIGYDTDSFEIDMIENK